MNKGEIFVIIVALLAIGFNEYTDHQLDVQDAQQPSHYEVAHHVQH